ncbi:MAG TPA: DUF6029 family protein, partial [bacterium]|nr:DUF6029 family protein [bacterium]
RKPVIQDPNSIGVEGDELVQRYARYHDDVFDVWAGNYDKTLGKGLTLRSYRDRDLEVYQQLDGGLAEAGVPIAGREWGSVTALWGRNVRDEELQDNKDIVAGGQLTLTPVDFLYVTGSGVKAEVENTYTHEMDEQKLYSGGLGGGWQYFDVYGEYATRKGYDSLLEKDPRTSGDGFYGIITGYPPKSSISVEYKFYDGLSYPYNNPPPVSYNEKMITGPGSSEPGEWGYYVRGSANPVTDVRVSGGYSYADDKVGDVEEKTREVKEYFGNARYDLPWPVFVEGGYESITDLSFYFGSIFGDIRDTPSLKVGWTPWDAHSFSGEFERERRTDYTFEGRVFTYNRGNAGYTYSSWLGLTASYEDTDQRAKELVNPGDPPEFWRYRYKNNWLWGEVRLTWYNSTFQNHVLTIGYGSQRGGLVCSSGVCKEQAPFSGLKVALESSF